MKQYSFYCFILFFQFVYCLVTLYRKVFIIGNKAKRCLFFGNFDVLYFLETPVLRFALLPYYRRYKHYELGGGAGRWLARQFYVRIVRVGRVVAPNRTCGHKGAWSKAQSRVCTYFMEDFSFLSNVFFHYFWKTSANRKIF